MIQTLHYPPTLRATVTLPSSKSESNRALILCALSGTESSVENLSSCDDTHVMWVALTERSKIVDVHAAGTAMRFLTAYFSICNGEEHLITGTQRMLERPIGVLVNALRKLGANITYEKEEGYPPVRIKGCQLKGGCITLPADISSQYISALLMIAPVMEKGLTLTLEGDVISRPYIEMTLSIMNRFGIKSSWISSNILHVERQPYTNGIIYPIESDWSAASYWYEMVALSPDPSATIQLPCLLKKSLQGDSEVHHFFETLGVKTFFNEGSSSITLMKSSKRESQRELEPLYLNLSNQPDLAQTLVVTCAMLQRKFIFTGLHSLRIKETDRIEALCEGLAHFGITLGVNENDSLYITEYPQEKIIYDGKPIPTFNDHRMAMSFAPAALVCDGVRIADPHVVNKSYPQFWYDLCQIGAISHLNN